jgi:hypothetical protein
MTSQNAPSDGPELTRQTRKLPCINTGQQITTIIKGFIFEIKVTS